MVDAIKKVEIDESKGLAQAAQRRFGLIVIGDEILSGRRQDKHMSKLIELLNERGLSLSWAKYVADDQKWFQLLAYALMLKEAQQKTTSTLELFYLSKKVKHTVMVTQENLDNARQVVVRTRASIDESSTSGQFSCNVTNLCDWCYYKKINVCLAHSKQV